MKTETTTKKKRRVNVFPKSIRTHNIRIGAYHVLRTQPNGQTDVFYPYLGRALARRLMRTMQEIEFAKRWRNPDQKRRNDPSLYDQYSMVLWSDYDKEQKKRGL